MRAEAQAAGRQLRFLLEPLANEKSMGVSIRALPALLRRSENDTVKAFERNVQVYLNEVEPWQLFSLLENLKLVRDPAVRGHKHFRALLETATVAMARRDMPELSQLQTQYDRRLMQRAEGLASQIKDKTDLIIRGLGERLEQRIIDEPRLRDIFDLMSPELRDRIAAQELPMLAGVEAPSRTRVIQIASGAPPVAVEQPESPRQNFFDRPGFHLTSWGTRHSLGSLVGLTLRYLTLSAPARKFGEWVQGGHDSGLRYMAGAAVKGLASITGSVAGIVGGGVSLAETVIANVGETVVRLGGAGLLGLAGAAAKLVGLASPSADRAAGAILRKAKELAAGISFLRKGEQIREIPQELADEVARLALLARITGSTTKDVRAKNLPEGFERVTNADQAIPTEILSIEGGGTGKVAKLRYNENSGHLTGDRWSTLMIGVYKRTEPGKSAPTYYLSFVGTQGGKRIATLKSNLAQGVGIEDSAFQEADAIVKAFALAHGADNVKLLGHSLGGGLATWAGIRNGVQVTGFNTAGLHVNMRNRLGAARIDAANAFVRHFNTAKDPISQFLESRRVGLDASSQVGVRYLIPNSAGHSLKHTIDGLAKLTGGAG